MDAFDVVIKILENSFSDFDSFAKKPEDLNNCKLLISTEKGEKL